VIQLCLWSWGQLNRTISWSTPTLP
jgi:hypothetical protein